MRPTLDDLCVVPPNLSPRDGRGFSLLCRQQDGQFEGWADLRAEGSKYQSGDPGVASHSPEVLGTHQMVLPETGLPRVKVSFVHRDCSPQSIHHTALLGLSAAWTLDCPPALPPPTPATE